jgi:hypothetical protein
MGLLDEAIREHIELKRRHGADAGELTRLEREAFGPSILDEEEVHEAAAAPAAELRPDFDEPASFAAEPPPVEEPPPALRVAEPPVEEPPPAPHLHEAELETEPPRPHGDPADRFPEPVPPAAEPDPAAAQPTREFDLDEVRAAAGTDPEVVPADEEPEAEDVLEETPEFLQETPEHDRLWFEQRPPRDFDF